MAELIKMPFGMWTRVHKRNYLLDGGTDPPREGALLAEKTSGFSHMPPSTDPALSNSILIGQLEKQCNTKFSK